MLGFFLIYSSTTQIYTLSLHDALPILFGWLLLNTAHRPFALSARLTLPLPPVSGEATLTSVMWFAAEAAPPAAGASATTHPRTPVRNTRRRMQVTLPRGTHGRQWSVVYRPRHLSGIVSR